MLTEEQIRYYEENGYIHGLSCQDTPEGAKDLETNFQRILDSLPEGVNVGELGNWNIRNNWVYSLASHPAVLDTIESLIGPDFYCWGAMIFYKPPKKDQVIRWHQGTGIWPLSSSLGVPLEGLSKKDGTPVGRLPTVIVAISDLTKENGCLRLLKGTHKGRTIPHQQEVDADRSKYIFEKSIPDDQVDESVGLVNAEMKAGQISAHHGTTIHSSGPNLTDGVRCGIAIRYATYDVVFDPVVWPQVWIQEMRGKNRFGTKHTVMPAPTEFGIPSKADLPHLDAGLSGGAKTLLKVKRGLRKVIGGDK